MIQRRPRVSFYIGAFVEHPGSSRPIDVRVSPIFETSGEFNQWLRNTHHLELEGITLTFHAQPACPPDRRATPNLNIVSRRP